NVMSGKDSVPKNYKQQPPNGPDKNHPSSGYRTARGIGFNTTGKRDAASWSKDEADKYLRDPSDTWMTQAQARANESHETLGVVALPLPRHGETSPTM